MLLGALHRRVDLDWIGDVELEHQGEIPPSRRDVLDLGGIAGSDDGAELVIERLLRQLAPEAGRATGYEPNGFRARSLICGRHGWLGGGGPDTSLLSSARTGPPAWHHRAALREPMQTK